MKNQKTNSKRTIARIAQTAIAFICIAIIATACGNEMQKCEDNCQAAYDACMANARSTSAQINCGIDHQFCRGNCIPSASIIGPVPFQDEPADTAETIEDEDSDCPCRHSHGE